jgi:hypothetical protein
MDMLASSVNKTMTATYFWIMNILNPNENITFGFEHDSVYVGARAAVEGGSSGVYGWALIAHRDGTATLQVRDGEGGAVTVDLLKAARVLKGLIDAEDATNKGVE